MLNAILGISSLLGGLQGANRTKGYRNKGTGYLDEARDTGLQSYRSLVNDFNARQARGEYNPADDIAAATTEAERNTRVGGSNISAHYGGLGYKEGDSTAPQALRHFSEKSQIQLMKEILGIKNSYRNQEKQDQRVVSQAGNNYSSLLNGLGNNYIGLSQQGGNSNPFAALSLLGGFGNNDQYGVEELGYTGKKYDPANP